MGLLGLFLSYTYRSFKDSLSILEADIYHANTLASEIQDNGVYLQIRISYSPSATFFLFLVQLMDCRLAEALGLLRILIYKVYIDGRTSLSTNEKKASINSFYSFIFPTLIQLRGGIADQVDRRILLDRYRRRSDGASTSCSMVDGEKNEECEICMEPKDKFVIPTCNHLMCMDCFKKWKLQSQACAYCRASLAEVMPDDLFTFVHPRHLPDLTNLWQDNLRRFSLYVDKLPLFA